MTNNKRKNLILFTSSFPCGSDEVFLENEYPFLLDAFEQIFIITSSTAPIKKQFECKKTTIIRISKTLSNAEKFIGTLKNIFSPIYHQELRFVRRNLGLRMNKSIQKTLISAIILQEKIAKEVNEMMKLRKLHAAETTLYSYWFDEFAYTTALLKKICPNALAISRAHGWDVYFERHPNNYLPLRKFTLANLDQCLVVSSFGAQYLKNKFKGFDAKISTSRLGTPVILTQSIPFKEPFQLVSCSSAIQLKRIDRIIHALQLIKTTKIHWIHFGSGALQEKLMAEATLRLKNSPNISWEFKGHVSNEKVIEYYKNNQVDLFINTSETEGIPVSIMEALSCSIPCIAPNVGGISEIVNEEVGHLLSSTPNEMEISIAIEKFMKNDSEVRSEIRANAKDLHEKYYNAGTNFKRFTADISSHYFLQPHQRCTRCLYDNHVYPNITFDSKGVCNICHIYEDLQERTVLKGPKGAQKINQILNEIKKNKRETKYDCLIGISGGIDSCYLVYLAKEWGLNPYVLHVDSGWNSDTSVLNIKQLMDRLDFDLHTYVLNWQEIRDVQKSFIKASVLDIDLPFDNTCMAKIFSTAAKLNIKYILTGHNTETEGWMPENFTHNKLDAINIKSIHRKYGEVKLKSFPLMGPLKEWYYKNIKGLKVIYPLDYVDYNKKEAKELLSKSYDWKDYGGKHFENVYTRFYQSYILFHKFGIDKRISHFSTLINSGQLNKEDAMEELKKLPYDVETIQIEKEFFIKKLGITKDEFEEYMKAPIRSHLEFNSYLNWIRKIKNLRDIIFFK